MRTRAEANGATETALRFTSSTLRSRTAIAFSREEVVSYFRLDASVSHKLKQFARAFVPVERHEEEEHAEEEDKDPNKVEWAENDPENPQK